MEIHSLVYVYSCLQTNNQRDKSENITSLVEVIAYTKHMEFVVNGLKMQKQLYVPLIC